MPGRKADIMGNVGRERRRMFSLHYGRCLSLLYPACLLFAALLLGGCAASRSSLELPPLLAQDEVVRPYAKLAVVQVTRERFGTSSELRSEDYGWAYEALREEAAKIGADAVILPEVNLEASSYLLFPSAQLNARGVAIRFR